MKVFLPIFLILVTFGSAIELSYRPLKSDPPAVNNSTASPGAFSTSLNVTTISSTLQVVLPILSELLLFHKTIDLGVSVKIPP